MESKNKYAVGKLNHLINIAEDGKEGYKNAAEDLKDFAIKSSFLTHSQDRSAYASELRQIVEQLDGDAEDKGGDSLGSMHRVWMDIKSTFTGGDTTAIINACITGEESAIKEYKSFLEDAEIPERCKPLVGEQLSGIQQALISIKSHNPN